MRYRNIVLASTLVLFGALARPGAASDIKVLGMYGTSQENEVDKLTNSLFDKDYFDHIYGGELQFRSWVGGPVGVGVAAGALFWQPAEFKFLEEIGDLGSDLGLGDIGKFLPTGKLTSFPIGGSVFVKFGHSPVRFVGEGGVRYVFNKSAVDWTYTILDTNIKAPFEFKVGDMVSGVLAADVEFGLDQAICVSVGAGYVFPLRKADVSIATSGPLALLIEEQFKLGSIGLKAYFLRAGVIFSF